MIDRILMLLACLLLAVAGSLSAYGFHGLDAPPDTLNAWRWAVDMHYYHGLGLLVAGALGLKLGPSWWLRGAGLLMLAGIFLFSGLIYANALGALEALSPMIPSGGSCFMAAWVLLAIGVWRGTTVSLAAS